MNKESILKNLKFPEGWKMKALREVCDIQNGFAYKSKSYINSGYRVIRIGNVQNGQIVDKSPRYISERLAKQKEQFIIKEGDILTSLTGDVGRVGVFPIKMLPAVLNQRVGRFFNIQSSLIETKYLLHFLNSKKFEDAVIEGASGAAQKNTSTKKILELTIPLPPLPQQKQIVATLDKAFAAIEKAKSNAEQNLKNAKELFESYLQKVFENKGDDWEEKTLGAVSEMIKRGSQPKYTESDNGEIVLNQKCIRDHTINLTVARKHDNNLKRINNERYVKLGDLLINSTGTGTLGRVAQVRDLNYRAFVDTHITIVRPKEDLFYLDFFGWAAIYIEKIIKNSGEGASGQTELSRKLVEQLVISFPRELKIQEGIALKLDSLSLEVKKLEAIYTQKIAELEEMKKSVLQKAFSGQLNTVT